MTEAIVVGIISGSAAVISAVTTSYISSSKTIYRIDQLEKKVEKHNQLVERMYAVESSVKSAHKRLDGIEKKGA